MTADEADNELRQWAQWSRSGQGFRYVSSATLIYRLNRGSTVPEPSITDEWAVTIDSTVAALTLADRQQGLAVQLYYLERHNIRTLGEALGVSHNKAHLLLNNGIAWIAGCLSAAMMK